MFMHFEVNSVPAIISVFSLTTYCCASMALCRKTGKYALRENNNLCLQLKYMINYCLKDRQQLIWPILVGSQYIEDLSGPPKILYTYFILLES